MEKHEYKNMYQQENSFWWYKTLHNLVVSIVKKINRINLKIFDAGCGTGRMLELLQGFGEVSGIDFSEDAVAYSKKRGLKEIYQGDLNTWSFDKNNKYDVIISLDVLCHRSIKNNKEVYQRIYNSLEKDGTFILNLPSFNFLRRDHDAYVHTKERYTKRKLKEQLESVGFKIKSSTYRMPILFCVIILQKIFRKIFKPKEVKSDLQATSKWINNLFYLLGKIENNYILNIGSIPFGSSVFVVAIKK